MPDHERQYFDVLGWPDIRGDPNTGETYGAPEFTAPDGTVAPAIPANTTGLYHNIDDPSFQKREGQWGTDPLVMNLPQLVTEPKTCQDNCDDQMKLRHENCSLLRKRVAEALKKAGCPSKVIAIKEKKVCGVTQTQPFDTGGCSTGTCDL